MNTDAHLNASVATVSATPSFWVKDLTLSHFRSYTQLSLSLSSKSVVLTGHNGAGKTNILEALSYLSPGRGLRQAKLGHVTSLDAEDKAWAVYAKFAHEEGEDEVGTGLAAPHDERRTVKINHTVAPQSDLPKIMSVFWMTPQIDQLLNEGVSPRRRFVDKLVASLYPAHTQHLYRYEYALRERSRLLRDGQGDDVWLSSLEKKMAEESMAIHSLRQSFLSQINPLSLVHETTFPKVSLSLEGFIETRANDMASLDIEETLAKTLRQNRHEDARTGGSKVGAHQTAVDFLHVEHKKKAEFCSTGEQKALLLGFILANVRLHVREKKRAPILLLDEVVAHLDEGRREALCKEILSLGVQSWMTGTDVGAFAPFGDDVQHLKIKNGQIE